MFDLELQTSMQKAREAQENVRSASRRKDRELQVHAQGLVSKKTTHRQ